MLDAYGSWYSQIRGRRSSTCDGFVPLKQLGAMSGRIGLKTREDGSGSHVRRVNYAHSPKKVLSERVYKDKGPTHPGSEFDSTPRRPPSPHSPFSSLTNLAQCVSSTALLVNDPDTDGRSPKFILQRTAATTFALHMTPLSPLNPQASHTAQSRPGVPMRKISFPPSRPLRPFATLGPKPAFSSYPQQKKTTKIIEAPKSFPGGCGFFVLNMTNDELARK